MSPDGLHEFLKDLEPEELRTLVQCAADSELAIAAFKYLRSFSTEAPSLTDPNVGRAARGRTALAQYASANGMSRERPDTQASDLISDLLHHMRLMSKYPHLYFRGDDRKILLGMAFEEYEPKDIFDPFRTCRCALTNFASELIHPEGDGPDLIATIRLNDADPTFALYEARQKIEAASNIQSE